MYLHNVVNNQSHIHTLYNINVYVLHKVLSNLLFSIRTCAVVLSSEAILLMDGFSTLPNGSDQKYTKYCISEGKACGLARGSQQHVKMLIPTSSIE